MPGRVHGLSPVAGPHEAVLALIDLVAEVRAWPGVIEKARSAQYSGGA